jgi:hypothetical protein
VFAKERPAAGVEFKQEPGYRRLANPVDKDEVFREVIALSEAAWKMTGRHPRTK